jgi:hypothetical protein
MKPAQAIGHGRGQGPATYPGAELICCILHIRIRVKALSPIPEIQDTAPFPFSSIAFAYDLQNSD